MNTSSFAENFYKNCDLEMFEEYMQSVAEWESWYASSDEENYSVLQLSKDIKKASVLRNIDDPWEPSQN